MSYAIEIDAAGGPRRPRGSAPSQDIHDAYRASAAKKHHPDAGGDDWAFRTVARAYEILSHARILSRIDPDSRAPPIDRPRPDVGLGLLGHPPRDFVL